MIFVGGGFSFFHRVLADLTICVLWISLVTVFVPTLDVYVQRQECVG